MSTSDVFDTDLDNFEQQVIDRSRSQCVLVDFWADWCPPCIALDPVLKKVVAEYDGKIALAKIEVDEGENMKLAGRYQVRGFPTILLIQDGEEKGRFSSMRSPAYVRDFIEENCSA